MAKAINDYHQLISLPFQQAESLRYMAKIDPFTLFYIYQPLTQVHDERTGEHLAFFSGIHVAHAAHLSEFSWKVVSNGMRSKAIVVAWGCNQDWFLLEKRSK